MIVLGQNSIWRIMLCNKNYSECAYETVSLVFFLSLDSLTIMAGVGVAHKLKKKKKNKKKITIQIFDKATSVKTIYKLSSGTGIPSHISAQP